MPRLDVLQGASKEQSQRANTARWLHDRLRGEVRFGKHDRMLYATDASMYQVEPVGVVIPADIEDALEAVRATAERSLPILPRGGGTSLAGQAVNEAVVLDFSAHCRKVRAIDPEARTAWVDAGITIEDLNDHLSDQRLFFPPDPSTARHANIGGCVGNNAAGTRSVRYGRTSESILGLDVATADGTRLTLDAGAATRDPIALRITAGIIDIVKRHERLIRDRFPRTVRRNAGYGLDMVLHDLDAAARDGVDPLERVNLAKLLCGSEGTLAVTLGAQLQLQPRPVATGLALVGFSDLMRAIECVEPILETGPVAVELLDDMVLGLARANTEYARYLDVMPQPASGKLEAVLYVEFFSESGPAQIAESFDALQQVMSRIEPDARVTNLTDANQIVPSLKLRKAGEPLLHGIPGDRKPLTFVEDNAVPLEHLPEFVRGFKKIVADHDTTAAYYAHASVGVLHVRPLLDPRDSKDLERMESISLQVADLAQSLGGVMSGEHGDGRLRGPLLERFYGPELLSAFREVKQIFDPTQRLNPGNIVDPQPISTIHAQTRVQPANALTAEPEVETHFDFSDQHGLMGAVEMCNGAGVCRKKSGGVMCPSYMASLDERHATRGRGNALRLAITGQLSSGNGPDWNDPETHATLDLCMSCKACKSECPSNVDIARLKAEYTAQSYKHAGRVPLKARVFANVRILNRIGAILPGPANFVNRSSIAKWLASKLLGIDPRREIPRFSSPLRVKRQGSGPVIGIFADCFCTYSETEIGHDAAEVLRAFGYTPVLINAGCCARPHISTGLLDEAIATADRTLESIDQQMRASGASIVVVLEPSCLSAIVDDWPQLKLATDQDVVSRVVKAAVLLEAFLQHHWEKHPVRPTFSKSQSDVLLHAHCHQKALWGSESSSNLLERLLGDRFEVADTTCCGMAGSFGYTKDRYEFSMRVGEQSVFPAVREASTSTVVAPGTSCRHQIHDGTGRKAVHPASLLASLLSER